MKTVILVFLELSWIQSVPVGQDPTDMGLPPMLNNAAARPVTLGYRANSVPRDTNVTKGVSIHLPGTICSSVNGYQYGS